MCSGLSSATVSFQGRHIWREQRFSVSIMNTSLHPVSTPRQMLMSQFFSGVPTDSIFFLILCSIGERMAQLSDVAKSQMEFCCCTKSLYCYHRSFLNSLVLLLFPPSMYLLLQKNCRKYNVKKYLKSAVHFNK